MNSHLSDVESVMSSKIAVFPHELLHFGQVDEKIGIVAVVQREQIILDIRKTVQYFQNFRTSNDLNNNTLTLKVEELASNHKINVPCREADF